MQPGKGAGCLAGTRVFYESIFLQTKRILIARHPAPLLVPQTPDPRPLPCHQPSFLLLHLLLAITCGDLTPQSHCLPLQALSGPEGAGWAPPLCRAQNTGSGALPPPLGSACVPAPPDSKKSQVQCGLPSWAAGSLPLHSQAVGQSRQGVGRSGKATAFWWLLLTLLRTKYI